MCRRLKNRSQAFFVPAGTSENRPARAENRYSDPLSVFYGIFFAQIPYSAFGQMSVCVCVRLRQKNQKRISILPPRFFGSGVEEVMKPICFGRLNKLPSAAKGPAVEMHCRASLRKRFFVSLRRLLSLSKQIINI